MADTILGGDFSIYYEAENRQKRIEWSGGATTRTANELYSALQDQFDELAQMDDGSPMSAQTPTEYTIGIIDAGDDDPWFIDRTTVEHITGGAIKTASWKRDLPGDGTGNTGIVRIAYTVGAGTDFVTGDIGLSVTHTAGDAGTLLDFVSDGTNGTAWIRPASNALANDWDSTGASLGTVAGGTGTALSQDIVSVTGESLWANIYSIGTIESNTHLYVQQNEKLLNALKDTSDWWSDGQVDVLVNVKECDTEIDEGVVKVLARQHSKIYDSFEVDLTAGGRNPIPLATADDLDNTLGHRRMGGLSITGGPFTVGEVITDDTDSTIQGVVTAETSTAVVYYLIGDPLNDFTGATGQFTGASSGAYANATAPADINAATWSDVAVTHGSNETYDIDEDGTTENYSIVIDCGTRTTLKQVYQRLQFLTRRGETSSTSTDGIQGQFYIGSDYKLEYTGAVSGGTIDEGNTVTQATTGAIGTVVSHNTTDKIIILRNSRGTFNTTNTVTDDTSSGSITPDGGATVITPKKGTPFGSFAGGKFFGAPGVVLANVPSGEDNNYQLTDDDGNVVVAPTKVIVKIGNTRASDRVAMFRLDAAGGNIKKDTYTCTAQDQGIGTVTVAETISVDEPGKIAGGILRVVDTDANQEYRVRFNAWAGSDFSLSSVIDDTMEAGSDGTTVVATGAFATAYVGDLILNESRSSAISYVVNRIDANSVEIFPAITGQTTGDVFNVNVTPVIMTGSDTVYVPLIDAHESTGTQGSPGSEQATITYDADIPVRVRARQAGDILPYETDATVNNTGLTNNVIRTADTIFT